MGIHQIAYYVGIVKDLLTIAACFCGVLTAVAALRGLSTWRRQMVGAAVFDAARALLRASIRLRAAIDEVRDPTITAIDVAAALPEVCPQQPSRDGITSRQRRAVYTRRVVAAMERWSDLRDAASEAGPLMSEEVHAAARHIGDCLLELCTSIDVYLAAADYGPQTEQGMKDVHRDVVLADSAGSQFTKRLDDAFGRLRALLDPIVAK